MGAPWEPVPEWAPPVTWFKFAPSCKQSGTSLVAQMVKRLSTKCRRPGFDPRVRKIWWRRKWQSTPILLPGKSHGQRSLVGYSPWGHKESDTTERLHFHFHFVYSQSHRAIKTWELELLVALESEVQVSLQPGRTPGSGRSGGCHCCSCSVVQSCPTLFDPVDCSTPGLPVHHQLPESTQTHVH